MKSVALSAALLIFIGLISVSLFLDSSRPTSSGAAPTGRTGFETGPTAGNTTTNGTATSTPAANPNPDFRGPTGQPHVIGPGAPPPNY